MKLMLWLPVVGLAIWTVVFALLTVWFYRLSDRLIERMVWRKDSSFWDHAGSFWAGSAAFLCNMVTFVSFVVTLLLFGLAVAQQFFP